MFYARSIEVVMQSFVFHLKGRTLIVGILGPKREEEKEAEQTFILRFLTPSPLGHLDP